METLKKAADAIESAAYNQKGGFILATANRAYYSCYYCMLAMLYTKDIYAKMHQGLRAKFSEQFIKSGIFPIEISDSIAMLFDYRQEADYDLDANITDKEADVIILKATDFYQLSKDYLQKQIYI